MTTISSTGTVSLSSGVRVLRRVVSHAGRTVLVLRAWRDHAHGL